MRDLSTSSCWRAVNSWYVCCSFLIYELVVSPHVYLIDEHYLLGLAVTICMFLSTSAWSVKACQDERQQSFYLSNHMYIQMCINTYMYLYIFSWLIILDQRVQKSYEYSRHLRKFPCQKTEINFWSTTIDDYWLGTKLSSIECTDYCLKSYVYLVWN